MKKLRFAIEVALFRALSALVLALPRSMAHGLARAAARLAFRLAGPHSVTLENLRVVFPDRALDERRAIGRKSYENFAVNVVDFLRAQRWSADELRAHVALVGVEHPRAALAAGKGLFFLTMHYGSFELGGQRTAAEGFDILAVGRPMRNARLWEVIRNYRGRSGTELVDRDQAGPAMLRALRRNRCVAALNDQYPGRGQKIFVPFLGLRAATNPGVAMLAVRTDAAIIPAYIERHGDDHHTLHFLPPLAYELTGDRKKDIEIVTTACNATLGDVVLRKPEEYLWGHRRFRHSPDLVDDPYDQRLGRR